MDKLSDQGSQKIKLKLVWRSTYAGIWSAAGHPFFSATTELSSSGCPPSEARPELTPSGEAGVADQRPGKSLNVTHGPGFRAHSGMWQQGK